MILSKIRTLLIPEECYLSLPDQFQDLAFRSNFLWWHCKSPSSCFRNANLFLLYFKTYLSSLNNSNNVSIDYFGLSAYTIKSVANNESLFPDSHTFSCLPVLRPPVKCWTEMIIARTLVSSLRGNASNISQF